MAALIFLCEGMVMRRYVLLAALAFLAVWMTGCVIINAGKLQSRTPATIRTEQCVVYQGPGVGAPVSEPVD
jgi:hypothetical protein